jgi:hypothetical protein
MLKVTDEIRGVFEDLWVSRRTLSFSGNQQTTSLTAFRPSSFIL